MKQIFVVSGITKYAGEVKGILLDGPVLVGVLGDEEYLELANFDSEEAGQKAFEACSRMIMNPSYPVAYLNFLATETEKLKDVVKEPVKGPKDDKLKPRVLKFGDGPNRHVPIPTYKDEEDKDEE